MDITTKNKFAYAVGGFGKNFAYGLVASYTLYYYNTVLGISASFVGILLMVARIFDALNDPFMGIIVAKTNSRYGKYKPWILTGAVLNAIVMYAMFTVPTALSGMGLKMYITITYFLCGITYTLSDIPYWSIIPAVTRAGRDREGLTVFARTFSAIGVAFPTIITMLIVPMLGRGEGKEAYRSGFSIWALIIAVVYIVTTLVTVFFFPTEKHVEKSNNVTVKELLNALIRNDQAFALAIIIILFNAATTMTTSLAVYMFDYEIGSEAMYTVFMAGNALMQLFSMTVLYPLLRRRLSNRAIFMGGVLTAIVGYLILAIYMLGMKVSFIMLFIPCLLVSMANGTVYVQTTVFVAGAVDYGEKMTGRREESVISSLQTLMVKAATALSAFLAGIGLDFVKFDNSLPKQEVNTLVRLRFLYAVPPLLMILGAIIVFRWKKTIGTDVK